MTAFVELETLTSGHPFGRGRIQPTTCANYWRVVDTADDLDWHWSGLTTPDQRTLKRKWWDAICTATVTSWWFREDYCDVAAGNLLISRDLNLCRQFCAAGGRALVG